MRSSFRTRLDGGFCFEAWNWLFGFVHRIFGRFFEVVCRDVNEYELLERCLMV